MGEPLRDIRLLKKPRLIDKETARKEAVRERMRRDVWRMIRRWFCQHRHTYRERRNGIPMFICAKCGHAEPVITRFAKLHVIAPAHERYQVKVKP